ncbi:MarC family NAAT transporter [Lysobacter arvi]|uniref:UPF0056 membrane protein n=1 Tax=Lysobacter arvi TaxID=3038776 RepID=A0ABU1CAW6_9GAMM|nr:MarC family NAAT transporter [Lysobacter arvi]MDR0181892.1 MarC family NAAT transporter [Lysobacter arvi]
MKAVGIGLAMLLPLTNPVSTVAVMLGLSRGMTEAQRNRQALLCSGYVLAIMVIAFYAGQAVMGVFGISISGLRIAGGLIVGFIGFRMLFPEERDAPEVEHRSQELQRHQKHDIAFIPLAMPTTAGPGTIAMLIGTAATMYDEQPFSPWVMQVAPVLVFVLVSAILLLCLRSASAIIRLLGQSGVDALSRLMGFLLSCMGVQFVINGVLDIVQDYPLVN